MIQTPTNIKFFIPTSLNVFDATAQPTIEGIAGEDYLGNALASTDQVINAMDSHSRRPFQADTDGVATRWRVDTELEREIRSQFWMIDGHNLRDIYPLSLKQTIDIYHDTNGSFSGATEIIPNRTLSGFIGKIRPYVRLNGVADSVRVANDSPIDVTTGDFGIGCGFRFYQLTGTQQLCLKSDGSRWYGVYLQNDDLWITMDDNITTIATKIGDNICSIGDDVAVHVHFDRDGDATAYVSLNGADKVLVGTVPIDAADQSLTNSSDLYIGANGLSSTSYVNGRIYWWTLWSREATSSEIDDEFNQILPASGVALSLNHDGLDSIVNKWNANYGNFNIAFVTGDFVGTPTGDDRGFYLAEYDEVDARYYFTDFNSNTATARATLDALIGQIVMGQIYTFNGVKTNGGFSGSDDYPGIMVQETVSGITQAEERYGQKNTFSLKFQISTTADFENLQEMNAIIKGMLHPFWICFNYSDQMPVIWRVRSRGGIDWGYRHGPSQPWSPSLELVMDI